MCTQASSRAELLVADVTGHTAYFNSACARQAETDYLITGELPASDHCGHRVWTRSGL
ncbi:alpha/beta hydrolase [Actinomadura nitritigenes]|uniref:alpha/beta hydrolase n=1 Tax=Actinomadura nitritigenes TaxID=134602 RepID=UPI003D91225C